MRVCDDERILGREEVPVWSRGDSHLRRGDSQHLNCSHLRAAVHAQGRDGGTRASILTLDGLKAPPSFPCSKENDTTTPSPAGQQRRARWRNGTERLVSGVPRLLLLGTDFLLDRRLDEHLRPAAKPSTRRITCARKPSHPARTARAHATTICVSTVCRYC